DQNQDGYADWMVSSPGSLGSPLDDRVDLFYGGSPPSQNPYLTFMPREGAEAPYMYNRRPIGDFNSDGQIDWVIGYWMSGLDSVVFEFHGGGLVVDTFPEAVLSVPYEVGRSRLARLGDHNGDGFDDIYYHYNDLDQTYIYFGAADWNMSVDLTNRGEPVGSGNSDPMFEVFGDFNGDGYDDYFVQRVNGVDDSTLIYLGGVEPDTVADFVWFGNFAFPATLSADLNSDGAADLAVSRDPRTIDVHLGGADISPTPLFLLDYQGCNNVAHGIASAGDYNRDGFEDLVIVNEPCANGFGKLCLWLGGFWLNSDVQLWRAIGVGDVNGDGVDDLAIGCQGDVLNSRRGKVVILSGDTTLRVPVGELPPVAEEFSLYLYPNPANGYVQIEFEHNNVHGSADVGIYNLLGQMIDRIPLSGGMSSVNYNASHLASGVYLVRANSQTNYVTQKLVVLK
ncbi:FG-GAP repeat protein, partial [bacterium]|nr:FG-GAP repeat protein [bacterium]